CKTGTSPETFRFLAKSLNLRQILKCRLRIGQPSQPKFSGKKIEQWINKGSKKGQKVHQETLE
ncbi:MAG: hypothetical protein MUF49_20060, partial [Oculatellaceae cyanobacterium Prado106]|nr:hypothetical protein [Oculatellaceae cyanobacterium Prado106]